MKILFRKIKSGFVRIGKLFSALKFQIKKTCTILKCLFLAMFSRERKTYIDNAEEKLKTLFPDKGYIVENATFKYSPSVDLSIIIATFNAEKYIDDCLNSIVKQSTKYDIEIIIVNDGSTDKTAEKIKPYLSDKRIRYFEQENQGQSVARNFAINSSIGKYLMIVDSDDVIIDGSIDCLLDSAIKNNYEIVEGKVKKFYNKFEIEKNNEKIKTIKNKGRYLLQSVGYSVAKVYKRELWENVSYPVGYIFEDIITKFILRRKAEKVGLTSSVIYGYRIGIQSSSHGSDNLGFLSSLRVLPKIWELCDKNGIPKDKTFYLLSLNHIGLLNFVMLKSQPDDLQYIAFSLMQDELKSIKEFRPKSMPLMFRVLDRSIQKGKMKTWQYIANVIILYKLLKKYREIN